MFSVSSREQFLLLMILAAMIAGVGVNHWRDVRREKPVTVTKAAPVFAPR